MEKNDRLLFSTENGSVHHCPCKNSMVLRFLGRGMALTRTQYRHFHFRVIEAVNCPLILDHLSKGGRLIFRDGNGETIFKTDKAEVEELLWLMDSARYMLDAREAAFKGFHKATLNAPGEAR